MRKFLRDDGRALDARDGRTRCTLMRGAGGGARSAPPPAPLLSQLM